ncbi:hypothetical protein ACPXCE_08985 [Streptomyces sp. DT24]|uniref:hypothetical protein n=1 Tax=Streptomyces sp. DT24 TaxID=3416520 RepID=UPI003CF4A834
MPLTPPARLRNALAQGLAAATVVPTVLTGGQASSAPASAGQASGASSTTPARPAGGKAPGCGDPAAADFPIETRIHGGPDTYAPGGHGTWYLDLTNTTSEPCRAIHPVLVLTDQDRKLRPDQIQLQFYEEANPAVAHRVNWETTDRDEQIGVFDAANFSGFTIPAGRTYTVRVRMGFTSDVGPGRIKANAAVVQWLNDTGKSRTKASGGDSEWVGESDDYTFAIAEGGVEGPEGVGGAEDTGSAEDTGDTGEARGAGNPGGTRDAPGSGDLLDDSTARDGEGPAAGTTGTSGRTGTTGITGSDTTDTTDTTGPSSGANGAADPARDEGSVAPGGGLPELARTGPVSPWIGTGARAGYLIGTFLLGGTALVVWTWRRRRARH